MKIRMLKSVPASRDGMKVEQFNAEAIETIDESQPRELDLANALVREGLAEVVDESAAPLEEPLVPPVLVPPVLVPAAATAKIEVGSVVENIDRPGQRMTVERLEADMAECVWFLPDNSGPVRDVFVISSLSVSREK